LHSDHAAFAACHLNSPALVAETITWRAQKTKQVLFYMRGILGFN
jgi:hypothetical protein